MSKKWIEKVSMKWKDGQSTKKRNATEMDNVSMIFGQVQKCVIFFKQFQWHIYGSKGTGWIS